MFDILNVFNGLDRDLLHQKQKKKKKVREKTQTTNGPIQNRARYIDIWYFFTIFSRPTRVALKFGLMTMFNLQKRFNGLDLVFGSHRKKKKDLSV